ncbi:MAG TPA: hypothetical protein VIU61_22930 [Kofleriaceae bacterium]
MRRALVGSVLLLLAAREVKATPYETFIDVDDQQDLEDLLASGDITTDTYDSLLELLSSGVDLNTADRAQLYALPNLTYEDVDAIIAYRDQEKGIIADPAALVAAGALTDDKLLGISAFLLISSPKDRYAIKGWVRGMTRWSHRDKGVIPFALRGRFTALKHVQAGFAGVFTRNQIGAPVYDPNRDALIAAPAKNRVHLPKIFVKYEDDQVSAIGGTFRAGFGQRLVFDNSSRYTPNGLYFDDDLSYSADLVSECRESAGELPVSPCDGPRGDRYITPDWRWRDGLFGVGAGLKKIELPTGWMQLYGWASVSQRSIYQYELVDRAKCPDPHNDDDPNCSAPVVYVLPDGGLLTPTSRYSFVTLPDVFSERLAGLNASYFADRRNSIGVTAYGATEKNLIEGIDLDTQEWSRLPTGKVFGAGGVNFAFGREWLDIFGEAAVSYDRSPDDENGPTEGGGDVGAILRVTATRKKEELETSIRYYGIDYVNPYARPISQPDELDGQRARDEVGFRVRYYRADKLVAVRGLLDLWMPPSQLRDDSVLQRAQPKLDSYARADIKTSDEITVGGWVRYQDKDLKAGGHDQCFEISTDETPEGEPLPCAGRQLTTSGRVKFAPDKTQNYTAMLEYQILDDNSASETAFRQDLAAWFIALWRPEPDVRLRGRVRFLDEAINDNERLERSISGVVDGAFKLRQRDVIRVRLDGKFLLDKRAATETRDPNPEFQVWLSYEARL